MTLRCGFPSRSPPRRPIHDRVTAAASAGAYFMRGDIDIDIIGPVALGRSSGRCRCAPLDGILRQLRIFFVLVLVLLALQMLMNACGITSSL